jgi:hypothetical protein
VHTLAFLAQTAGGDDVFTVVKRLFNDTISTGQLGAIAFGVVITVATFVKSRGSFLLAIGMGLVAAVVGFMVGNLDFIQQLVTNSVKKDQAAMVQVVPMPESLPPLPGDLST